MRVRVWDAPTRLFHWLIVLIIPFMWWTAEEEEMDLHRLAGCVLLGLVVFRLLWGLFGGSTARFSNFVKGPRAVISYLSGRAAHVLGHNPLGGWSVIAMLGLLSAQIGLGLFASDEDGIAAGPLSDLISYDLSEEITDLHEFLFNILLALIALHVAAILFYALVRRRNLVGPMLTGADRAPEGTAPLSPAPWWRFVLAAAIAASLSAWMISRL